MRGEIAASRQVLARAREEQARLAVEEEAAEDRYIKALLRANQKAVD